MEILKSLFFALLLIVSACAHRRSTNRIGASEFLRAAASGDVATVQRALGAGISPDTTNSNGTTAVMVAAKNRHLTVLRVLVDHHANLVLTDPTGDNVMSFAVVGESVEVLQLLLKQGLSPNLLVYHDLSPLALTIWKRKEQLAKVLIENGADLNFIDTDGCTPLMNAVETEQPRIVEMLLQAGANTAYKNTEGLTAEDQARNSKNSELMAFFENIRSSKK